MTTVAIRNYLRHLPLLALIAGVALFTLYALTFGITFNQALALMAAALILTIWHYNKVTATIAAAIFFMVKPFLVRLAFWYDFKISGTGGFDLLGITPALLLAAMIVIHLYPRVLDRSYRLISKTEIFMAILCGIGFLSIFNPVSSLLIGLGGFERNILPNMMILFLAAALFKDKADVLKLIKALMVLGIVSCLYAVGQYILGVYPWEADWLMNVAFKESFDGWYTIGLRGIELRIFSIFYGYMDFTFVNALIFALVLATRKSLNGIWRRLGLFYMISWFGILILTVERMPMLMSLVAIYVVVILNSTGRRRIRILTGTAISVGVILLALNLGQSYLKSTGAQTFIRLAEMANPLSAGSIGDRAERKWRPTLQTIRSYPLGVGIGFGSETKANQAADEAGFLVQPHNEILQKTLETGIVGGIVYLLLLIWAFKDGLRLSQRKGLVRRFGFGMVAGTIGFWLCGLVNLPFSGSPGLLYWLAAGVVLGLLRMSDEKPTATKTESKPITAEREPLAVR